MEKQKRTRLPKETQDYIIKMIQEEGVKVREMSRKFEVGESTIHRWLKILRDQEKQNSNGSKFITTKDHEKMQAQFQKELHALKEENEILKKGDAHLREKPRVIYAFIQEHAGEFPIAKMCKVLKVSKSGYYAWLKRETAPLTEKQLQDQALAKQIFQVFIHNLGVYGSPRIHAELKTDQHSVSQKKIANMMRDLGLKATPPKAKFGKKQQATLHTKYENVLGGKFEVGTLNKAWVGDITYIWTEEGWLYLATLMDLGSRRIVGWAMADHMETSLIEEALKHALSVRKPAKGWIHHSDQGAQYTSDHYTDLLTKHAAKISMSRKGTPGDNACIEAFHSTIKKELIHRQTIETIQEGKKLVENYIMYFYNERRRHSSLGYLSPNQYERQLLQIVA